MRSSSQEIRVDRCQETLCVNTLRNDSFVRFPPSFRRGVDALAGLPCRARPRRPYGCKQRREISAGDAVDALALNARKGVAPSRCTACAAACDAGAPHEPATLRLFSAPCRAPLSETELALAAVDGDALDPGLAAANRAGLDEEIEAFAIAVWGGRSSAMAAPTNARLRVCCGAFVVSRTVTS